MKHLPKIFILIVVIAFWSCRDTKEPEQTVETEVQQEESLNKINDNSFEELEESSEELDKEVKEMEDAIKELDTI